MYLFYFSLLGDWSRDVKNCSLIEPVTIQNWVVLYPVRSERDVDEFLDNLHRVRNFTFISTHYKF
jgi:hypothetical protein